MEDKRRDSVGTPPMQTPPPATSMDAPGSEQPASSRRRGGGQKRKFASVNSGGGNSSTSLGTSSKRQAKEKPSGVIFPSIHTNGPCTRARVHPHNSNSFYGYGATPVKSDVDALDTAGKGDESSLGSEGLEALGAKIEAEYEAIRSRDANVHVVPIHAGWFMWTEIHPLEQKMLPSFFNGKSENRNSEIYMAIRNSLVKKFHYNPNEQIDTKHLSELTVGELDARQEVMEFLDYWGLINYHPFPPNEAVATPVDSDVSKGEAAENDSLVSKLFKFETVQSWTPVTPRASLEMPSTPSGFFPESVVADELLKPEGPSVEYHCNSCSTDCSRKRYHCQKQADYDLCADCFTNGKFGSDMSPTDFILMESTEAAGTSGGNWTDQETLLLLEAIELFRDNWSEIAEHVATKSKAQCIMHFVQMPIEDAFFSHEDASIDHKESALPSTISTEDPTLKADPNCDTSIKDLPDGTEGHVGLAGSQECAPAEASNPDEIKESNGCREAGENLVLKALNEAFEAAGCLSSPGERKSFLDAGNPAMALAAFLVRLVDPNNVAASVQSLLKFTSGNHSSEELAARHCFLLEDPPNEKKKHSDYEGAPPVTVENEIQKDAEKHAPSHSSVAETMDSHAIDDLKKDSAVMKHGKMNSSSQEKKPKASSGNPAKKSGAKKSKAKTIREEAQLASVKEPSSLETPKELENGASSGHASQNESPRDQDMASLSEKKGADQSARENSTTTKHNGGEDGSGSLSIPVKNNDFDLVKLKQAAVTALSAAAVKAKLLADQEEEEILRLSAFLVEKELYKLEAKLAFCNELDNIAIRGKEQIDKLRAKLLHERSLIIASRIGGNRPNPQTLPPNIPITNFPNLAMRPTMAMNNLPRPPLSRPMTPMNPVSFINASSLFSSSVQPNLE